MSFNFKKPEGLSPRKNIGQQTDKAPIKQGVDMDKGRLKDSNGSLQNVKRK